jgi:hypothetical protein
MYSTCKWFLCDVNATNQVQFQRHRICKNQKWILIKIHPSLDLFWIQDINLHRSWFFKLSRILNVEHEITAIYILHHKEKAVLEKHLIVNILGKKYFRMFSESWSRKFTSKKSWIFSKKLRDVRMLMWGVKPGSY